MVELQEELLAFQSTAQQELSSFMQNLTTALTKMHQGGAQQEIKADLEHQVLCCTKHSLFDSDFRWVGC